MKNKDTLVSVIIPFMDRKGDKNCLLRLYNSISCFVDWKNFEVIVYDTSKKSCFTLIQLSLISKNINYYHEPSQNLFSPGKTRNQAIKKASGRYIFIFDADLLISYQSINLLIGQVKNMEKEGPQSFRMFPCLYLSKEYSYKFISYLVDIQTQQKFFSQVLTSYLKGEISKVDSIALASSCLLIRRDWFMALGGFRNCFVGYGYEDFDLIHRLSAYYPIGVKPVDYTVDRKQQFPANYQGFRGYYSYYALSHLFENRFLLHQWHPRPLSKRYYRKFKLNGMLLADALESNIQDLIVPIQDCDQTRVFEKYIKQKAFDSNKELPEIKKWITKLQVQYGYPLDKYFGLFRWHV